MEKDIKQLTDEVLKSRINELEHTYAELFCDDSDYSTLKELWKEIQLLKAEIRARGN